MTTFTDDVATYTENIRYLAVNAPSAYNILLGRPAMNRLRVITLTRHMKMKLPSLGGTVITIGSDQNEAKRCYENILKTKRGVYTVTTRPQVKKGSPGRGDQTSRRRLGEGDRWQNV